MTRTPLGISLLALTCALPAFAAETDYGRIELGPRPAYLISTMDDGPLKDALEACASKEPVKTDFSIAHRGAQLMFPEHSERAYAAALKSGAGIMECDVTFTKDHELVCRHAQNDLHTTTNILATDLAENCTTPFSPATGDTKAQAECRASDITLAQYQTLTAKMDAADSSATNLDDYMNATANWRTDMHSTDAKVLTHAESIAMFKAAGAKFTPELKDPAVDMPHDGFTMDDYAQKMINEYKDAGVPASDVFAQSFNLDVIKYWIENEPEFGKQAVYLDGRYDTGIDPMNADTFAPSMDELKAMGVNYIAPPMWMLVTEKDGKIVPSVYAEKAKEAGLELITWTLERSGPLASGGGWYFQSTPTTITKDGDVYKYLDVLAQDVGVVGVFSDWPATVTYYASCMGLK